MATSNATQTTTIEILESSTAAQYHAIAFNDGLLANNGEEASGILLNKPASGEFATLAVSGESKFAAGAAITKGAKLTVTTSGWFTTAASNDANVGEAKYTVTSGSLGTGLFSFAQATYSGCPWIYPITAAAIIEIAGAAVDLSDNKVADASDGCDGIALTTAALSGTINVAVSGIATGLMGAVTATAGMTLMATTSGYLVEADSGDMCNAKCLTDTASGITGAVVITHAGYLNL